MGALIHVTAWERAALWRRLVCAVARVFLLIVVLIATASILGPPLSMMYIIRMETTKVPLVKVVPLPLKDYSVSTAPGTSFSFFRYQFEVPWKAAYKTKGSEKSGVVVLEFDSGRSLVMFRGGTQGLLVEVAKDQSMQNGGSFGELTKLSPYDQYALLLRTSPSTIGVFGPRYKATLGMTLLTIKAIASPASLESGAFSFQQRDTQGFQIGDPEKSQRVQLVIFDKSGYWTEILCLTDKAKYTQPELNRILATFHTVPAITE
jgi:hypothetical protein